ncbi:PPOX class F420-dependent oxidoreductase [Candidatus Nitrosocosmicus hydrocola]|uniref:PPOX class F420-dependent oxidoreductase n=1 Tax=Candidatus Nitrosocosmicus hydrocola TaxID=1826872 RepID=UPI0011E5BF31|nr:PPOX class F420-dependent oxidoreductase [Candidatus Nitrosocosmicus hydrocola]
MFTETEIEYIKSQRLARIATSCSFSASDISSCQPDVAPVGFDFDGMYFYVGGINILKSTKYKNVLVNNKVAIVIDDLRSIDPWEPRGIRIYGIADTVDRPGGYMSNANHPQSRYIRIKPTKKWSWGIDEPVFVQGKFNVKKSTNS